MAKDTDAKAREHRLAAKLRENLKRRKGQAKARAEAPKAGGDRPKPASGNGEH